MSTNMQNVVNKTPNTPPSSGKAGGGMGLNLSGGMEAAVTAALSLLQKIFCEISNLQLKEYQGMATANQKASENSATFLISSGVQQSIDALAQGIGAIGGSFLTLSTMGIGEKGIFGKLKDPNKPEFERLSQEEQGIQLYKDALPKKFNAVVDERPSQEPPVYGPQTREEAEQAQAKANHSKAINERLDVLKKQRSFVNENKKALDPETSKSTGLVEMEEEELLAVKTDKELISGMSKKQTTELNDALESRLDKILEEKTQVGNKQASRRQAFAAIGNSLGQAGGGVGSAVGAEAKKTQAEDQATSQLSNSASQGIQGIMSQLLKTANDALSQAQQAIQTFATISNGNKFQG